MNKTKKSPGAASRATRSKRTLGLSCTLLLALTVAACGASNADDYAGIYTGDSGRTTLELKTDGEAIYTEEGRLQQPTSKDSTTWRVEDGQLIVAENDALDYDIYATVDDASKQLFFQSDDSSWNNELFTKVSS